jgi:hypothetical protein
MELIRKEIEVREVDWVTGVFSPKTCGLIYNKILRTLSANKALQLRVSSLIFSHLTTKKGLRRKHALLVYISNFRVYSPLEDVHDLEDQNSCRHAYQKWNHAYELKNIKHTISSCKLLPRIFLN